MRPDDLERRLQERLDALGPAPRAELLRVLMLPDLERAQRIGEFWSYPQSRAFAELLIDAEEDRVLRAVLVGMLREMERQLGNLGPGGLDLRLSGSPARLLSRKVEGQGWGNEHAEQLPEAPDASSGMPNRRLTFVPPAQGSWGAVRS
jgi:hypothetical protein